MNEITYPFPNFHGATAKVWEWISNFILYCIMDVITHPCRDLSMKGVTSVDIHVWATRPTRNQQQRQGDMTISMNESWSLEKKNWWFIFKNMIFFSILQWWTVIHIKKCLWYHCKCLQMNGTKRRLWDRMNMVKHNHIIVLQQERIWLG